MNNAIKANANLNRRSENENTHGTGLQSMICDFGSELPGCQREKGCNWVICEYGKNHST